MIDLDFRDASRIHPARGRASAADRLRIVFMYLGRGAALGNFMQSLAASVRLNEQIAGRFVVSRMNPCSAVLARQAPTLALPTFAPGSAIATLRNFFAAKRMLQGHLRTEQPHAVINLMPHMWTPLWVSAIRKAGVPYVSVVHDAVPHPGDPTGKLLWWLHREARSADLVVTLSRHVADQLDTLGVASPRRISKLFLPDFKYAPSRMPRYRDAARPLRLLFFGRILTYKGLPLLLDAVELVRARGVAIELGIAGAGDLRRWRDRLGRLDGEVINRWVEDREVGRLLARYDAMVLPYVECSQSAAAATALGAGMPIVGLPSGGLREQIVDGVNGVLARQATAQSLADAIHSLAADGDFYARLCTNISATANRRSMDLFLSGMIEEVIRLRTDRSEAPARSRGGPTASRSPAYATAD